VAAPLRTRPSRLRYALTNLSSSCSSANPSGGSCFMQGISHASSGYEDVVRLAVSQTVAVIGARQREAADQPRRAAPRKVRGRRRCSRIGCSGIRSTNRSTKCPPCDLDWSPACPLPPPRPCREKKAGRDSRCNATITTASKYRRKKNAKRKSSSEREEAVTEREFDNKTPLEKERRQREKERERQRKREREKQPEASFHI